jgi:hypothetical protein
LRDSYVGATHLGIAEAHEIHAASDPHLPYVIVVGDEIVHDGRPGGAR